MTKLAPVARRRWCGKIHDNLDRYVDMQLALSKANQGRARKERIDLIDLCAAGAKAKAARLLA